MFSEFARQEKFDSRLDLTATEGLLFVVSDQLRAFHTDSFKGVLHKGVHDIHSSSGDTDFRVDLFENFVDIQGKGFLSLLLSSDGSLFLMGVSGNFLLEWHFGSFVELFKSFLFFIIYQKFKALLYWLFYNYSNFLTKECKFTTFEIFN